MVCSKKKPKKLGSVVRSESGSNVSRTIVLYNWRWYRHKDLFIFQCPQGLSGENQSVACVVSLCSCFSASSERAPAVEVLYLPECHLAGSGEVA